VEGNNFAIRKHLLEYDDVMNKQREVVYDRRLFALESEDISGEIRSIIQSVVERCVENHIPQGEFIEKHSLESLKSDLERRFLWTFDFGEDVDPRAKPDEVAERARNIALAAYEAKRKEIGFEGIKNIERSLMLAVIDKRWRDHLYDLDGVRAGIGLRAYGQKDPLIEYKSEAFDLFVKMLDGIDEETVQLIFHARWVRPGEEPARPLPQYRAYKPDVRAPRPVGVPAPARVPRQAKATPGAGPLRRKRRQPLVSAAKVGRNDPCPCGSGKKYKKCCGR
jgi:preprotein translocase subunit SecA